MMLAKIPIKRNPKLFEKVIAEIQKGLAEELPWLSHAFGKAERLVKTINGKKLYLPNVYIGNNEYMTLEPDSRLGNYCFFVMREPQKIDYARGRRNTLQSPFSVIFWVDMRTIESEDERNTEAVKQQILRALNGGMILREGRMEFNQIYEKAENVFNGFTLDEIDNQFLMHPYAGFRFDGTLYIEDECIL